MAITVKHSGNAAPLIAAAYEGGRGKRRAQAGKFPTDRPIQETYASPLEEGMTTRPASTVATQAGFQGPTPVGAQRPNSVASQAGFAVANNLDGTVNLTPQEIAANAMKAAGAFGGKTPTQTPAPATEPSYLDKARLERSEYDYKQRMDRSKMDYENRYQPEIERTYGDEEQAQLDNLNKRYSDAVNSGAHTPQELAKIKEYVDAQKANIVPREKFKQSDITPSGHKVGVPYLLGKSYVVESSDGKTTKISDAADDPEQSKAKEDAKAAKAEKDSFDSRYEAAKKELTVEEEIEVVDADENKTKVKTGKFTAPKQEDVIARLRELDSAREAYLKGVAPEEEVVDPAAGKTEIPPPVEPPPYQPTAEELGTSQFYSPVSTPKDFQEDAGLTIGEIGQAFKSRGDLKDSRLDFKGLDPQRRAEIEKENEDLAELSQMSPVELYNMAAQMANEKQTSVAEQLHIVRDYISGR